MHIITSEIESYIVTIQGQKVMLDSDIASLYGVETKRINEQVRRNSDRFPEDFVFQLTEKEFENLKSQNSTSNISSLRSQNATLKNQRGQYTKYLPYAFTEQGVYMLATVLKSTKATQTTIAIMRAFTKMRQFATGYMALFQKIQMLEVDNHKKFDKINEHLNNIYLLLEDILENPKEERENIMGFIQTKD